MLRCTSANVSGATALRLKLPLLLLLLLLAFTSRLFELDNELLRLLLRLFAYNEEVDDDDDDDDVLSFSSDYGCVYNYGSGLPVT